MQNPKRCTNSTFKIFVEYTHYHNFILDFNCKINEQKTNGVHKLFYLYCQRIIYISEEQKKHTTRFIKTSRNRVKQVLSTYCNAKTELTLTRVLFITFRDGICDFKKQCDPKPSTYISNLC